MKKISIIITHLIIVFLDRYQLGVHLTYQLGLVSMVTEEHYGGLRGLLHQNWGQLLQVLGGNEMRLNHEVLTAGWLLVVDVVGGFPVTGTVRDED